MDVTTKSFEYHDKNREKYEELVRKIDYLKLEISKVDTEHNVIVAYDEDDKEMFRSRIESLGNYFYEGNAWVWGWAMPLNPKNITTISRKLLKYGFDIHPGDFMNTAEIRYHLITARQMALCAYEIEFYVAVASYLTKHPFILEIAYPIVRKDIREIKLRTKYSYDKIDYPHYNAHLYILDFGKIKV